MRDVIQRGSSYFVVSTQETLDCGPETMVFPASESGMITSFAELYVEHYSDMEKAVEGHHRTIKDFQPENSGGNIQ